MASLDRRASAHTVGSGTRPISAHLKKKTKQPKNKFYFLLFFFVIISTQRGEGISTQPGGERHARSFRSQLLSTGRRRR
jgi:hypothetical protein